MARIPKKARRVKRVKKGKPSPKPSRYVIRKDSLNRRYGIDKRTGKRVSVSKAEKERQKRKKAKAPPKPTFHRIKPPKATKPVKRKPKGRKSRSEAAKKGWETRRKKIIVEAIEEPAPISERHPIGETIPPSQRFLPEGVRMRTLGGIADRAETFPKVARAAEYAWNTMQAGAYARRVARMEDVEPPVLKPTGLFDKYQGPGEAERIRYQIMAQALDLDDLDAIIEKLIEEGDYKVRELYTLYFSPEVA